MKKTIGIALLLVGMVTCAYPQKAKQTLVISFENVVNGTPLTLGNTVYKNANGDSFTVSALKYYVSNFRLQKKNGEELMLPPSYFLVNAADKKSAVITLNDIPAGQFTGLSLMIGVDSIRNVSGVQTGALDPANKMFWTWNSGYIFLKLEGTSPQSATGKIGFDIGGIKPATNSIRWQHIPFSGKSLGTGANTITLQADIATLFNGKQLINFSTINKVMGGAKSVTIADNYSERLFKLVSIKHK